jgi:hypothetical protein
MGWFLGGLKREEKKNYFSSSSDKRKFSNNKEKRIFQLLPNRKMMRSFLLDSSSQFSRYVFIVFAFLLMFIQIGEKVKKLLIGFVKIFSRFSFRK